MYKSEEAFFYLKFLRPQSRHVDWAILCMALAVVLAGCSSAPRTTVATQVPPVAQPAPTVGTVWDADVAQALAWASEQPMPAPIVRARSLWQPVDWATLPGLQDDDWHNAWHAWVRSCERPPVVWQAICRELRPQLLGTPATQLAWMVRNLQPYRVVNPDGTVPAGLLTGYYEPVLQAKIGRAHV